MVAKSTLSDFRWSLKFLPSTNFQMPMKVFTRGRLGTAEKETTE